MTFDSEMEELQEVEERIMFSSYLIRPVFSSFTSEAAFVALGALPDGRMRDDEPTITYDFHDSIARLNFSPSISP